jgi:hypothetical protein
METMISLPSRKAAIRVAMFGLGVFGFSAGAEAVIILPGQAAATTGITSDAGPVIVDSGPVLFTGTNAVPSVVFTGTLDTKVIADTQGLDFVYQFSDNANSLDSILRLTASGFTGYATDADYIAGSGAAGPFLVSRSPTTGDVIGFSFLTSASVAPGQTSDILVIRTNAQAFTVGNVSVQDGGNATVASFEPVAVPEPATMGLIAIAFSGLTLRRRRA